MPLCLIKCSYCNTRNNNNLHPPQRTSLLFKASVSSSKNPSPSSCWRRPLCMSGPPSSCHHLISIVEPQGTRPPTDSCSGRQECCDTKKPSSVVSSACNCQQKRGEREKTNSFRSISKPMASSAPTYHLFLFRTRAFYLFYMTICVWLRTHVKTQ